MLSENLFLMWLSDNDLHKSSRECVNTFSENKKNYTNNFLKQWKFSFKHQKKFKNISAFGFFNKRYLTF